MFKHGSSRTKIHECADENDDFDGVRRFCDSVVIEDDLLLIQIADQLLDLGKPRWDRRYSSP